MSDNFHVSYSEISDWKQCRFKHHLGYSEMWRSQAPSPALELGTAWHKVMDAHYSGITNPVASAGARSQIETGILAGLDDQTPTLEWMYEGYVERWGTSDDEPFDVIAIEEELILPIPEAEDGGEVTHLKARIDMIGVDDQGPFVLDHKTAGQMPSDFDLELDQQFVLYAWIARELGYNVRHGIRNLAKTKKLKRDMTLEERFVRHPVHYTGTMINTAIQELITDLEAMNLSEPTRSPARDCSWKCSFREACLSSYRRPETLEPMLGSTGHLRREVSVTEPTSAETLERHRKLAEKVNP